VIGPGEPIHLDPRVGRVVAEGELAMVIRGTCRNLTPDEVPGAILGWTIGNDVTATDQIALDDKMTQAKNGDGFTPLGPWIETDLDPRAVEISVGVAGHVVAEASTSALAWDVVEQLVYLSSVLTLSAGDVVLTGAPQTSAQISAGQLAEITLSGIGTLTNPAIGG
jgi:2-keto-4-pentenoate hydratase/2-oxohepta-3-ene-1,7-dioic acid hydratase in catechol pathway